MSNAVISHRFALSVLLASSFCCAPLLSRADEGIVKDALTGCSVFKPNLKAGEAVLWKGACSGGSAEGNGVAQWSAQDGSTVKFEGRFTTGKMQGVGRMLASGGDRYEGNYKDGKRDGRGVYISANGDRYEGEYKDNQRHGHGVLILANGNRVAGDWQNGVQVSAESIPKETAGVTSTTTQPQLQGQLLDRQSLLAQREADKAAAKELRDRQRSEQQQSNQLAAQQREEERVRRQLTAQQVVQDRQRQLQLTQAAAQEDRQKAQMAYQAGAAANRQRELFVLWTVLLLPLGIGALITLSKWGTAVSLSNTIAEWIKTRREIAGRTTGFFTEFILRPVLWCFYKLVLVTDSIDNSFTKAGVRGATWIYLIGLILLLLYWLTVAVITIVVLIAFFWFLGAILRETGGTQQTSPVPAHVDPDDVPIASHRIKGHSFYSGTNCFNEELSGRVDEEGLLYKGTNWFAEEQIGRIDEEGNIFRGTNPFNETKVGRIDKDGMLYKGSNWFTEEKTGQINEDGTVMKGTNFFNEVKTGRIKS